MRPVKFGSMLAFTLQLGTTFTLRLDYVITLITFPFAYNYSTTVTTLVETFTVCFFTLSELNDETNPLYVIDRYSTLMLNDIVSCVVKPRLRGKCVVTITKTITENLHAVN